MMLYRTILSLGLLLGLCTSAIAQSYPVKPITLLVPFPPGTAVDVAARIVATKATEFLGQPVLPTNRDGASGNIAIETAGNAAPDGYTLVLGSTSFSINIFTIKGSFPLAKFTPVAMVGMQPYTLMVPTSVPAKNIKELVALFKSKQGQFNAATGGPTGTGFFLLDSFKKAGGFNIEMVAYKGTTLAVADLLESRTHMLFAPLVTALPHMKSGKIMLQGITGSKRSPLIPDVPTFIDSGFPMLDVPTWFAVMGPAGVSRPVVTRINQAVVKALTSKDVIDQLTRVGIEPTPGTPEEADAFLKADVANWAKMVKQAGVKAQ